MLFASSEIFQVIWMNVRPRHNLALDGNAGFVNFIGISGYQWMPRLQLSAFGKGSVGASIGQPPNSLYIFRGKHLAVLYDFESIFVHQAATRGCI